MPNGGPPIHATSVSVITLGDTGGQLLDPLSDALSTVGINLDDDDPAEDGHEEFIIGPHHGRLVHIDTEASPRSRADQPPHTHVRLEASADQFARDRETADYLPATRDLGVSQTFQWDGPLAQRALGRYYVEANAPTIRERLRTVFEPLGAVAREHYHGGGVHQLWIVTALGEWFGSGALPLVAALAREVATDVFDAVLVGGLGVYPTCGSQARLDRDPQFGAAYATLRELSAFLDFEVSEDEPRGPYPLSLSMPAPVTKSAELVLERRPFELFGLVEGPGNDGSSDPVMTAIADAIAGFSRTKFQLEYYGAERYGASMFVPDGAPPSHTTSFDWFSVTSHGLAVPTELLARYRETSDDLAAVDERLESVEADLADVREAEADLAAALETARTDPQEAVPEPIKHRIDATVAELPDDVSVDWVETRAQEIVDELDELGDVDEATDETSAPWPARAAIYEAVVVALDERLAAVDFPAVLDETVAAMLSDGEDEPAAPPLSRWRDHVRPALEAERERLEQRYTDMLPVRIFRRRDLAAQRDEVAARIESLTALAEMYEQLQACRDEIATQRDEALARLRERREELTTRVADLSDARDDLEATRENLRERCEATADALGAMDETGHLVTVPIDTAALADAPDADPSLRGLYDCSAIHERRLREAMDRQSVPAGARQGLIERFALTTDVNRALFYDENQDIADLFGYHLGSKLHWLAIDWIRWIDAELPGSVRFLELCDPIPHTHVPDYVETDWFRPDLDIDVEQDLDIWATEEYAVSDGFVYPEVFDDGIPTAPE